jgi:hypothetical protein
MVRENHPLKPFYRVGTELLHIGCAIVDYYGAHRMASM